MLDMDLTNRDTFASLFLDLVNITVKDLSLNLNMSTVTGLADLIEDEVIPVPFPVKVNIAVSPYFHRATEVARSRNCLLYIFFSCTQLCQYIFF